MTTCKVETKVNSKWRWWWTCIRETESARARTLITASLTSVGAVPIRDQTADHRSDRSHPLSQARLQESVTQSSIARSSKSTTTMWVAAKMPSQSELLRTSVCNSKETLRNQKMIFSACQANYKQDQKSQEPLQMVTDHSFDSRTSTLSITSRRRSSLRLKVKSSLTTSR